ncbi:transcription factor LHW isoform X1 [Diospyros lotus]|uniref:transcription factor LHW isoform X1 n=1 Tax=Diospyros lotus TaxID=55363 RepID=UPI00225B1957|nr:transcription factor LHW isoform X1 [Diospyros lotus]
MGYLLKEVLKTLCGVNQWSYAVFWKIGYQNPELLIWEECYYESIPSPTLPPIAAIGSSGLVLEEWEASCVSAEHRNLLAIARPDVLVPSLVDKMMMCSPIKVVGQGLVGRAAFTGKYLWVLSENYAREAYPPEVQNEVCQQFSAGIKTVAIIPILSHGVVQFGSSLAIMENVAFVNTVKSLMLQLGCVPGALLSDNYTAKEHPPMIGAAVFPEKSISADPSGNYKVKDSVPSLADGSYRCYQQSIPSQAVGSHFTFKQIENNLHGNSSTFQTPNLTQNIARSSLNGPCLPNIIPGTKPGRLLSNLLEIEETRAEVISLNPHTHLSQQESLYNHRSKFGEQPPVGPSSTNYSNSRINDAQRLPNAVLQERANNYLSNSCGIRMSQQLSANGNQSSSAGQLQTGGSDPRSSPNLCSLLNVHKSAGIDVSCTRLPGIGINAGPSETEVSTSKPMDHLTLNHLLLQSSGFRRHSHNDEGSQTELPQRNGTIENNLFQALNIPSAPLDEQMSLSEKFYGLDYNNQKPEYGNESSRSKSATNENDYAQPPSGDDLFDILGMDFKKKVFSDSWNNFYNHEPDTNKNTSIDDMVTSLNPWDADPDLYSFDGGNSDSGIFSVTGTDHLLDAVVNKARIALNQSSDESASCKTTLTKINGSSVPIASPSYGQVSISDQKQGEFCGLPKPLAKLAPVGSCSFKSECNKDTKSYSQANSVYGSQINSWVEQGDSTKHNNSASTAYSKRPDEVSKLNRKRLKPGENPRPRPKDRQMIQDRLKELREIVPNGAKCSIDGLLERTIKHMLFLQGVTKHADKLKQIGESKLDVQIASKDPGMLLGHNFEGGRTWAYEVGSQSMVCPIIVEDLNAPRQMLVKMLCEERGLFLEIADMIKGLGLTILKGVMETLNDKVWARFAVEANRDVTRVEVFLSLVHLLEKTGKRSAASGNGAHNDNMNMTVQQHFPQAAPVSASGRSCSLH